MRHHAFCTRQNIRAQFAHFAIGGNIIGMDFFCIRQNSRRRII
jgi:hypothetical protein